MDTSEKVSIFARLNVKGGIPSPSPLHNPPMRVDTLSRGFINIEPGDGPASPGYSKLKTPLSG